MPGARTYKAIGYVTYNGGRLYVRRRHPGLQRAAVKAAVAVVVVGVVVGLATEATRRSRRVPSV